MSLYPWCDLRLQELEEHKGSCVTDWMLLDFWKVISPLQLCFFLKWYSVLQDTMAREQFFTSLVSSIMGLVRDFTNLA